MPSAILTGLKKVVNDVYTHRGRWFIFWLGFKLGVLFAVLVLLACVIVTRGR